MRGYTQPFAIASLDKGQLVAGAFGDVHGGESEAMSNARLIAAVPDLLTAAKAMLEKWELIAPAINGAFVMQAVHGGHYTGPTIDAERNALAAAIAKAEGR